MLALVAKEFGRRPSEIVTEELSPLQSIVFDLEVLQSYYDEIHRREKEAMRRWQNVSR